MKERWEVGFEEAMRTPASSVMRSSAEEEHRGIF
jgi:hypothetical protein